MKAVGGRGGERRSKRKEEMELVENITFLTSVFNVCENAELLSLHVKMTSKLKAVYGTHLR